MREKLQMLLSPRGHGVISHPSFFLLLILSCKGVGRSWKGSEYIQLDRPWAAPHCRWPAYPTQKTRVPV